MLFFTQKAWCLKAVLGKGQPSSAGAPSCSNVPEYDVTGVLGKGGHFRNRVQVHGRIARERTAFLSIMRAWHDGPYVVHLKHASSESMPHSKYRTVLYAGATRA
jgi:hypothetical protein